MGNGQMILIRLHCNYFMKYFRRVLGTYKSGRNYYISKLHNMINIWIIKVYGIFAMNPIALLPIALQHNRLYCTNCLVDL